MDNSNLLLSIKKEFHEKYQKFVRKNYGKIFRIFINKMLKEYDQL